MGQIIASVTGTTSAVGESAFADASGNRVILSAAGAGACDGKVIRLRANIHFGSNISAGCEYYLRWHSGTNPTSTTVFTNDTQLVKTTGFGQTNSTDRSGLIQAWFVWSSHSLKMIGFYNRFGDQIEETLHYLGTDGVAVDGVPVTVNSQEELRFIVTINDPGVAYTSVLTEFVLEQP